MSAPLDLKSRPLAGGTLLVAGLALWFVAALAIALTLPLLPVDETRYLTVAWEMRDSGNWLLPTLNGVPYSHKPPLLFWLVNIAWTIFGTNVPAARLVSVATSAGVLFLTFRLAKELFPDERETRVLGVLMLLASPAIIVYGNLIMFDQLLAVWVLLGLLALWRAARDPALWQPWAMLGLALGLGLLTKGPVILLHLGLPALLVMLWRPAEATFGFGMWLGRFLLSLAIGAAMILAWAIPAAISGGPEFAHMIFWKQSAGRMVESFDHRHPFWFYIPVLGAFLLPFFFWRPLWRAVRAKAREPLAPQVRFLIAWIAPVFVAFSIISGKQPHYLLPLLPGIAILGAHLIRESETRTADGAILAIPFVGLFAILTAGPLVAARAALDAPTGFITSGIGNFNIAIALAAAAIAATAFVILSRAGKAAQILAMVFCSAALLTAVTVQARLSAYRFYDLQPVADALQPFKGQPLAFVNKYVGELGFLAQLDRPMEIVRTQKLDAWLAKNPDGTAVMRTRAPADASKYDLVHTQPFRSGWHYSVIRAKRAPTQAHNQ